MENLDASQSRENITDEPHIPPEYNEFVGRVIVANPELSSQQAYDKITELEKIYNYRFSGVRYPSDANKKLVNDRNRLSILNELNLLTDEEDQQLKQLKEDFAQVISDITEVTGDEPSIIQKNIDAALKFNVANNLTEAKEIMLEGPIIKGFEETEDVHIPNSAIREFLKITFTPEMLRKIKIGKISKDDTYMIFVGTRQESNQKVRELIKSGIIEYGDSIGILIAKDKESYLQAEILLENVTDPSKLEHTFKIRAGAGAGISFKNIPFGSFGVEKSADFDYLATTGLKSDEDQMRAYILGTVVHEIAHSINFDENMYKQILDEEIAPQKRSKFVSDYVLKHSESYKSSDREVLREDFAETVRIYTTNPDYLRDNYPKRFAFIKQNFPFIKLGSVIETVKKLEN